ncbi:hypothetical protein C2G38_2160315 [Gigaspora rosea]|uniref:Uncharacterized protein n=1 Tax=Gigaspora rosea TaxID=44941 RepID=A0A397W5K7_9GLOM|nr:hypothetical protein C2G38_2160315 [Gigaspora rosea]
MATLIANRFELIETTEFKKVDLYAIKFKSLLSQINLDKGLLDRFIVGMILSSLKRNNTTFVTVAAPKDLNEAITAARRVEACNYYRQYSTNRQKALQQLESELKTKRKKGTKAQNPEIDETRQEMNAHQNLMPERSHRSDNKEGSQLLQYPNQKRNLEQVLKQLLPIQKANLLSMNEKVTTIVVIATSSKAKMLDKVRNVKIVIKDIVIPTTFYIIEPTEETLLNLKPYEEKRKYDSEGDDTFDEFNYEEDEEIDEVERYFLEEYYEENLALFLTNIEEVPMKENKKETNIVEKFDKL